MSICSESLLRSTVAGKYFLKDVAEDEYLAEAPDGSAVSVKLATPDDPEAEAWSAMAALTALHPHRNLLASIEAGLTRIDGKDYAYLASERIEDRVADALAERPLAPEEASAVLEAALCAVGHLHTNGYSHGGLRPEAIVAASGQIKLLTDTTAPLPREEEEARRAIAGDLIALGETATSLLTRQTGPAAAATLPEPFAGFVRSTTGVPECPAPTAAQLLGVLRGTPLAPPETPPAAPPPAHVTQSSRPVVAAKEASPPPAPALFARTESTETPKSTEPAQSRRPTNLILAAAAVGALALVFAVSRWVTKPTVTPAGTTQTQTPAPAPTAATAPQPATPVRKGDWAVVAATYRKYGQAAERAAELSKRNGVEATVLPPEGKGNKYFVVLGTAATRKEAAGLLADARKAGLRRGTYVTRLRF